MLIGSTFAWFTDSVTSGVNQIKAGNLDIDVLHTSASVTTAESISERTNLFRDAGGSAMLWEPGAVSYETFTVKNLGSLSLKYNLALNITDYNAVSGTNKTLKDVLKVMVLTTPLTVVTRDTVAGLTWDNAVTLDQFKKDGGNLYPAGGSNASEETFQVIVYWQPTDNDNQWNVNNGKTTTDGQPLFIDFGINVIATQLQHEADSFGSDYDQGIVLPDLPVSINKTFQSAPITNTATETVIVKNASTNTGVATMPEAAANAVINALIAQATDKKENTDVSTVIYLKVETDAAKTNETSVTYNIDLSAIMTYTDTEGNTKTKELVRLDGNMGGQIITATMNIGKGLSNVNVNHDGTPMNALASATTNAEGYFYNKSTGDLTIKSKSFSPFTVDYTLDAEAAIGNQVYATLQEALAAAADDQTVTLLKNVVLTATTSTPAITIDKAITLDGNGKTITVTGDSTSDNTYGIYVNADTEIQATIKNLTLKTTGTERAIRFGGKAGGTVKDVKITSEAVGIHVKGTGAVTIDNADITVNAIAAFTAHKRAGVVVGAETTATMNNSRIVVNVTDRDKDNGTGWYLGKGAYVGTFAKGELILNNTNITADFALAIDGSDDAGKLNNITVNSGTIKGDLGSPSGYSYKEIVIKGGTFAPYSVNGLNGGFYSKDDTTARMEITGGTFSAQPDTKYIANGYTATESSGGWTVKAAQPTNP